MKIKLAFYAVLAFTLLFTVMTKIFGKVIITPSEKRKPSFAGSWYEADSRKLRPQLAAFLKSANAKLKNEPCDKSFSGNAPVTGTILAGIAPHAGYMFSGSTAGFIYDALKARKITRVFLLGPSHYVALHGCALPVEKTFATPLGDLRVDTGVINELKAFPLFKLDPDIHRQEHSLEMQLPFIKQAFGNVTLVPIIVGTLRDEQEMRLTGQILSRYLQDGDVVLVSSDFIHYGPRYDYVPFPDDAPGHVRELDHGAFEQLRNCDLKGFIEFRERTHATICGYYPCTVLLSMLPAQTHATVLSYQTSRDIVGGPDDSSVSYLAIAFSNLARKSGYWSKPSVSSQCAGHLLSEEKAALLQLARRSLTNFVVRGETTDVSDVLHQFPELSKPAGAFVTLYRRENQGEATAVNPSSPHEHKELRGCIGYIYPVKSIAQAVADNAIGASSKDPRFKRVQESELTGLQIDVNVLTPPKPVDSFNQIRVGVDGVILYKAGRQSVFLPSVATEFGWSLEEMLTQLSLKAECGVDGWRNGARFDVFQAESFLED